MAKHYPQTLWDAIRAYWENTNAGYEAAAKAVCKGESVPSTPVIFKRAKKEKWQKKGNEKVIGGNNGNNALHKEQVIEDINKSVRKKADLIGLKGNKANINVGNGLSDVILNNIHLSPEKIDELCEDYRAEVLSRHRADFDAVSEVVNKCVLLFKKVVDILSDGGKVEDGDVVEKNGFVHEGMLQALKMIDISLKAMVNVALIKNYAQTNERKAYGLETYEEANSSGDLAKKALSQTGMGNHYERIRLGKPDEKAVLRDRLKDRV